MRIRILSHLLLIIFFLLMLSGGTLFVISPISGQSSYLLPFRTMQFNAFFSTGVFLNRLCHYGRATEYLTKARECGPANNQFVSLILEQAIKNLALHHYTHGNYTISLPLIISILEQQEKKRIDDLLLYGMCLWHLKDYAAALEVAEKVVALEPVKIRNHIFKFRCELATNGSVAFQNLEQAHGSDLRSDPDIMITIGDLLWNFGHYEIAARLYEEGNLKFPAYPAFNYRRALYDYRIRNNSAASILHLQKLLSMDYTYPGARAEYNQILNNPEWPTDIFPGVFPERVSSSSLLGTRLNFLGVILNQRRSITNR
ncbi:tetratricopeptide repeat protein [candidate division CSSED10-310 bacterium]|uniref:Tetratricopeptide repeat protein n=1 Tax=candidate division CSSED10-310 bacterium TaxID=2855610 RepID=A0ABV6Z3C4_UNCC1